MKKKRITGGYKTNKKVNRFSNKKAQLNPEVVITAEQPKTEIKWRIYLFIGIVFVILLISGILFFGNKKDLANNVLKSTNQSINSEVNFSENVSKVNSLDNQNKSITVIQNKTNIIRRTGGGGSGSHPTSFCTPNCQGKICGDDLCGGSCGTCSTGSCVNNICVLINNCTDFDNDHFNQTQTGCGLGDCNDNNATINPLQLEICNGIDDDCDDFIDEGCNLSSVHPIVPMEAVNLSSPEYIRFKNWVDLAIKNYPNLGCCYAYTAVDAIMMYRLTGDVTYANNAIIIVEDQVTKAEIAIGNGIRPHATGDSYYYIGELKGVLLTYDWAYNLLNESQKRRWENYTGQVIFGLWNCHQYNNKCNSNPAFYWSGWATTNPGNNYYYGFLEATMLEAVVMQNQTWLDLLNNNKTPLLVNYFKNFPGGGSREGIGYGTSHMSLFEIYRIWKSASGEDLSTKSSHCIDSIDYWIHATVPTLDYLALIGDLARDSTGHLYDYQRHLMLEAVALNLNTPPAERGTWWLNNIYTSYGTQRKMYSGFSYKYDLLPLNLIETKPTALMYYSPGTGHIFARSSWETNATWISFIAGIYDQSHAHNDQGSFMIYKNGWLAYDEVYNTHSGITQDSELHNLVRFVKNNTTKRMKFNSISYMNFSDDGTILNLYGNMTDAYMPNFLDQWTDQTIYVKYWYRNLTFNRNTLVVDVIDNFEMNFSAGMQEAVWQVNTPVQPIVQGDGTIVAGNLTIVPIEPLNPDITIINWSTIDSTEYYSGWRVDIRGSNTSYKVQLRVNSGSMGSQILQSSSSIVNETNQSKGIVSMIVEVIKDIIDGITNLFVPDKNTEKQLINSSENDTNSKKVNENNSTDEIIKDDIQINDSNLINTSVQCIDIDNDIFNSSKDCGQLDCDDNNFKINPRGQENCTDNIDNNCNGLIDCDDTNCKSNVNCIMNITENDSLESILLIDSCRTLDIQNKVYKLSNDVSSDENCFIINETNITIDCDNHEIIYNKLGNKNIYGIYSNKNATVIKNCIIKESKYASDSSGIYFDKANFGKIFNNKIIGGYFGISLQKSSNNNTINSNIVNANKYGIYIWISNNANVLGNEIRSNIPMELRSTVNTQVLNNKLVLNYTYNNFYALSIRENNKNILIKDCNIDSSIGLNNGIIIWDAYSSSYGNVFENININASGKALIIDDPKFINATFIGGSISGGVNDIYVSSRTNGTLIFKNVNYDSNKVIINNTGFKFIVG